MVIYCYIYWTNIFEVCTSINSVIIIIAVPMHFSHKVYSKVGFLRYINFRCHFFRSVPIIKYYHTKYTWLTMWQVEIYFAIAKKEAVKETKTVCVHICIYHSSLHTLSSPWLVHITIHSNLQVNKMQNPSNK